MAMRYYSWTHTSGGRRWIKFNGTSYAGYSSIGNGSNYDPWGIIATGNYTATNMTTNQMYSAQGGCCVGGPNWWTANGYNGAGGVQYVLPVDQQLTVNFYPNGNVLENQELKVEFYPDGNIETEQELQAVFYPDGNVSDVAQNQQLDVAFYPDGNVSNVPIVQELKVCFYPDGNIEDIEVPVVEDGFKWWFGMKGKKKYGRRKVTRLRW